MDTLHTEPASQTKNGHRMGQIGAATVHEIPMTNRCLTRKN